MKIRRRRRNWRIDAEVDGDDDLALDAVSRIVRALNRLAAAIEADAERWEQTTEDNARLPE